MSKLNFLQQQGIDFGLTEDQVRSESFGFYVILSIKTLTKKEKPTNQEVQDAYKKIEGLSFEQVSGVTNLGLTREQILSAKHFEYVIFEKAIGVLQKRHSEKSKDEIFDLIKDKNHEEIESYLEETKPKAKPLSELDEIRIVVEKGRGFGHQTASITLMRKLREMGFKGTFDIRYNSDVLEDSPPPINSGDKLRKLLPGLGKEEDKVIELETLGKVRITRLPINYEQTPPDLFKVDLAMMAAGHPEADRKSIPKILQSEMFASLHPTDWLSDGEGFVIESSGVVISLKSEDMRLSSQSSYDIPSTESIKSADIVEEKILSLVDNENVVCQLVYGLYEPVVNPLFGKSSAIEPKIECSMLIKAHLELAKITHKPAILFLSQDVALDKEFQGYLTDSHKGNVHFVDLTRAELDVAKYKEGDFVIAYTGGLSRNVFDYLMLTQKTLPPVIEGSTSCEVCSGAGRAFIHGNRSDDPLKKYDVEDEATSKLHSKASRCLERGTEEDVNALAEYMTKAYEKDSGFAQYHQQRQEKFLERPNMVEVAFKELGIEFPSPLPAIKPSGQSTQLAPQEKSPPMT